MKGELYPIIPVPCIVFVFLVIVRGGLLFDSPSRLQSLHIFCNESQGKYTKQQLIVMKIKLSFQKRAENCLLKIQYYFLIT